MGVIASHYRRPDGVERRRVRHAAALRRRGGGRALQRPRPPDLRDFAYTDPLTGLASRRRLDVELAKHKHSALSLLLIDFDGLKAVNDTLSYDRGDVLIQTVGAVLAANVNEGEVAARLGGDEFVVVLPGCDEPTARMRAEEVTQLLDGLAVPEDLESLFHGASVGNATGLPGRSPRRAAAGGLRDALAQAAPQDRPRGAPRRAAALQLRSLKFESRSSNPRKRDYRSVGPSLSVRPRGAFAVARLVDEDAGASLLDGGISSGPLGSGRPTRRCSLPESGRACLLRSSSGPLPQTAGRG